MSATNNYLTIGAEETVILYDSKKGNDTPVIKLLCLDETLLQKKLEIGDDITAKNITRKKGIWFFESIFKTKRYRDYRDFRKEIERRCEEEFGCRFDELPQFLEILQVKLVQYKRLQRIIEELGVLKVEIRFFPLPENKVESTISIEYAENCVVQEPEQYKFYSVEKRTDIDFYVLDIWKKKLWIPYREDRKN